MKSSKEIRAAVRELRRESKMTQTQFAQFLGNSLSTIQRYETLVAPSGKALATLAYTALAAGRRDLARTFSQALLEGLGISSEDVIQPVDEAFGPIEENPKGGER